MSAAQSVWVPLVSSLLLAGLIGLLFVTRWLRDQLRMRRERARLFTLSQDLLCVQKPDGTVIHGNPAFERYFPPPLPGHGRAPAAPARAQAQPEPDGQVDAFATAKAASRFFGAIHPADLDAVRRVWDLPFDEIPPIEFRVRVGNEWRWLSWSMRRDRLGRRPRLYAVAHDITSRKTAEQTLASEIAFRRAMEDSIWTGMRAIDTEGRITYVNPAMCRLTGFDERVLIGSLPPYAYWAPEDYENNMREINAIIRGQVSAGTRILHRIRRRDGTMIDVSMHASPLIDADGRQAGWMSSFSDITEPNRIRLELAEAHERFTTVLDELGAAVSVAPLSQRARCAAADEPLLFANRQYQALFGASANAHHELLASAPTDGDWKAQEVYIGSVERWFEVRSRRITWVDGQPVRLVVANDFTATRQARELEEQQIEQLQQTSRLVTMGEMASSIAHELNQPLSAISNYTSGLAARLRRDAGPDGVRPDVLDALHKTAHQAQRAAAVIRRIRSFVKRSEPERRRVRVAPVVADALGLAEIAAKRSRVSIKLRLAPDLPDLHADPILIEQVLINLLKNGIDAMQHEARRELTLSIEASADQLSFAVADLGPGLPAEVQGRLFEPFFTTKPDGMGIGLNICRSVVESHGGRLWVEPNEPVGSVFRFVLPTVGPASAGTEDDTLTGH